MKQKIKFYTHKVKINYADDLPKVAKYFYDKIKLELEFLPAEETKIGLKDTPADLYLPNDGKYSDVLMYMFDRYKDKRANSSSFTFSKRMICIEISTSVHDDKIDYTWKGIAHELLHSCFQRLRLLGIFLEDPMDAMMVNGVWTPYYKNDDPFAPDGNFAEAFNRLAPYWDFLYPKPKPPVEKDYFKTQEFVSKAVYEKYGEKSIWFIDPRIKKLANFTREFFGKSVTINNWLWGGQYDQSGFREPESTTGASMSQHRYCRGIDIKVAGMTPKAVHEAIMANEKAFIEAGLTTLEDIADTPFHVHMDIRWTGLNKILIVKP